MKMENYNRVIARVRNLRSKFPYPRQSPVGSTNKVGLQEIATRKKTLASLSSLGFLTFAMTLKSKTNSRGQALVEFVLVLFMVMGICAGMLYFSRLLTTQYWAQQEARFLAYEQTWVPAMAHNNPYNEGESKLSDSERLKRPGHVENSDVTREGDDDGGLTEILQFAKNTKKQEPKKKPKTAPIMLAKVPWFQNVPDAVKDSELLVNTAWASQKLENLGDANSNSVVPEPPEVWDPLNISYSESDSRVRGFSSIINKTEFGEQFCRTATSIARKYGYSKKNPIDLQTCGQKINRSFAHHLAYNIDYKSFFLEVNYQLGGGQLGGGNTRGDIIESVVKQEVASQFYSFFDSSVATARAGSIPAIVAGFIDYGSVALDSSVVRMISEIRYAGSSIALLALETQIALIVTQNPGDRSRDNQLSFEEDINDILHYDYKNDPPVSAFILAPDVLPVPPFFGDATGGIFSGLMKNVLFYEDGNVEDDLIENSNKMVEVVYDPQGGLFGGARRRFNTTGKTLTARHYLVTQPWHITRQVPGTLNYRTLGDQFDTKDDETSEGVMRRRVLGLWMFPSNVTALLDPITALADLDALDAVFSAFEPIGSFVGEIKGFLTDNPLFDVFDALSELPGFGSIIPTLPKWPAVRPAAYPGSQELDGDMLMGAPRTFQDYVDEQEDFNPPPDPEFN